MRFKVESYEDYPSNVHICRDEDGNLHRMDLLVDGSLEFTETLVKDLVGKTIECERTHPFIEIAHDVRIIQPPNP